MSTTRYKIRLWEYDGEASVANAVTFDNFEEAEARFNDLRVSEEMPCVEFIEERIANGCIIGEEVLNVRQFASVFDAITKDKPTLAGFLRSLPVMEAPWDPVIDAPWDAAFQKRYCSSCTAENCDACANEQFRNNPEWWLSLPAARSVKRKELFNMKENKHGFEPKTEFTIGGIAFTVIQTGEDWVKCIASECVEERAFDAKNRNDFAASDIRAYLNGEFLRRLIAAGAPEEMFEYFNIDLTADDGLKTYGGDRVRVGLITCEEYRLFREHIPALPNDWWWTATADSPINSFVRNVLTDGTLFYDSAYYGNGGVRPLCNLKSEILKSYLSGGYEKQDAPEDQREKAVDMMKHIAAAWDIDAEEVFGRADE